MKLQTIKRYIAEHRAELSADPERVAILRRIVVAEKARLHAAGADPLLSQAFLRIERVASGVPVALFGQPVPSRAFNRIELIAGRTDPQTGDRVPGETLISVLASEEALTKLILRSNRGDPNIWMTGEALGGYDLGPFAPAGRDDRAVIDGKIEDVALRGPEGVDRIIASIRAAKLPLSAKFTDQAIRDLDVADQARNAEFYVGMHHEILSKRMVAMQVEAANTVINASRIMQAAEQLRLAPPEEAKSVPHPIEEARLSNPLLNAAVDHYSPQEAAVLREVLAWSLRTLATGIGLEDYEPLDDDAHASRLRRMTVGLRSRDGIPEALAAADELCRMLNQVSNPHILSARESGSAHMLTAAISQVSGSRDGLHSDYSRAGSDLVRMTISKAEVTDDFGRERVRERNQLVELHISPEEFMIALRGHPTGEPVRCKITWIHGQLTPDAPYRNRYDAELEATDARAPDAARARVHAARKAAADLMSAGIRTKADRDGLIDALNRLRDQSELHGEDLLSRFAEKADRVEGLVDEQYRDQIGRILAAAGFDPDMLALDGRDPEAPAIGL
ncbi:hypothetical protein [Paracoccus sp. ME4]|uniref:hypothetical protein n=1 Tax=Paracoccus sp. ME4 TaxID=3138066 RepID=UPI00398AE865